MFHEPACRDEASGVTNQSAGAGWSVVGGVL